MTTEISSLTELTSAQANKFVTYNANLRKVEGITYRVLSKTNGGPPVSPVAGDTYIVDSASGAWSTFTVNNIAHYYAGSWKQYTRFEGLRLWIMDTDKENVYNGSAWVELAAASSGVSAFTTGSVVFVNSGAFAQDNTNFFWDDTNNRLGILDNTPSAALEVGTPATDRTAIFNLKDNLAAGFTVIQGSDKYIDVSTVNSSENISFGNTATNPTYSFLGTGTATFSGSVIITADLTVNGTATTISTTNIDVEDSIITLADGNAAATIDIGFLGERSGTNIGFVWDESADEFVFVSTSSTSGDTTLTITDYLNIRAGGQTLDDYLTVGTTYTAGYGMVRCYQGSSGSGLGASPAGDALVVEGSTNVGMSFLSPNTATQSILFADPQSSARGYFQYDHSTDLLSFGAAGATVFYIGSNSQIRCQDGSAANPVYTFNNDLDNGLYLAGTNALGVSTGGTLRLTVDSTGLTIANALFTNRSVEANTAGSGSPNILTATESFKILTNEGTTAENYHTLPSAVAGYQFTFVVQDADGLRITADTGDTIRIAGSVSASAGFVRAATIGNNITLVAINATEWVAISTTGTWTIDS